MKRNWLHDIAYILLIIGGINWGLVGLLDVDLVEKLLGNFPTIGEIVYVLIAASAVYIAVTHTKYCKFCSSK